MCFKIYDSKGYVQTDSHWMNRSIIKNELKR